ncbi:Uncharacterized protein BM_BM13471 [Brugia malayi]|uniref:Bm13471 n=2 Tax=Brugia TaxID=6278 RepID=A0A0K0IXX6_BRUMA|nr:Uncharacterized protein BM_BM13471 [Brugia malayi]CDP96351.1 Bm13471 [Brugia malayi]VDO06988.1 unnamed protein product [Brugia timori]VIO98381.1 Uncharacterized protein BM_BM13471 [Brugia malayi]
MFNVNKIHSQMRVGHFELIVRQIYPSSVKNRNRESINISYFGNIVIS